MIKQRRCLKFTAYLYVPDEKDMNDKRKMKYWLGNQPGALRMYDEDGNEITKGAKPFGNLGGMLYNVMTQYKKMWNSRFK